MKKIDLDKFYEGIRIKDDPGQFFVVNWINLNAKNFRESWENSCCQHCKNWFRCGHEVKKECQDYEYDKEEIE
jgi:hypothetical protein